jgi:hypothetical protein
MEGSNAVDQAILAALEERPFSSVRDLAKRTCILLYTIHWRLTNSISFVVKHLRWIPRRLNEAQLAARVQISSELLRIIRSVEYYGWQYLLTFDESWFYLSTNYKIILLRKDEPSPARKKHMIQAKEMIITIVCDPIGFHVIGILPKVQTFNAAYYTKHNLQQILEFV